MTQTLGITGGIGSGKSTVCRLFEELGARIFYADEQGKRILVSDPSARAALTHLLGSEAYFEDGTLNRQYVASRVFADDNLLAKLNLIVHPRVEVAFGEARKQAERDGIILLVLEAALLFESELHRMLDDVAVVVSQREARIERVVGRDGVTRESVAARMRHQAEDVELLSFADHVIENNGSLEDLARAIHGLYNKLIG